MAKKLDEEKMEGRRSVSIWILLAIGLGIGLVLHNVRAGLILGVIIGLCAVGLLAGKK